MRSVGPAGDAGDHTEESIPTLDDPCSERVIGACIEVHRHLGPGLLESTYEACLCHELTLRGVRHERQRLLPLLYKGVHLECGYRLDLIVEDRLVVEIKSVDRLLPIHEAQVLTYLRLTELPVGLLFNFNVPILKRGLRRLSLSSPDDRMRRPHA